MIDVWLIFTMMYPFSVVALYSLLEFLKKDPNVPVPLDTSSNTLTLKVVSISLNCGLPLIATIFIIFFWVLGVFNAILGAGVRDSC